MGSIFNVKRDEVVYLNEKCVCMQWPLQVSTELFDKVVVLRKKYHCGYQSNSSSGFTCMWEITDKALYLTDIHLAMCHESEPFHSRSIALHEVFSEAEDKVLASWFSGALDIVLSNKRVSVNEKSIALFENKVVTLNIEFGKVISTSAVKTETYTRRVLKDYIQE